MWKLLVNRHFILFSFSCIDYYPVLAAVAHEPAWDQYSSVPAYFEPVLDTALGLDVHEAQHALSTARVPQREVWWAAAAQGGHTRWLLDSQFCFCSRHRKVH